MPFDPLHRRTALILYLLLDRHPSPVPASRFRDSHWTNPPVGILRRLEAKGVIASAWFDRHGRRTEVQKPGNRRMHLYWLTPVGKDYAERNLNHRYKIRGLRPEIDK